jgi:general secretion pathway protein A
MLKEYLKYWMLEQPPFSLSPDPNMLYLGKQHHECLLRLKYTFYAHKGGGVLISENAGEGKTTIIRKFIQDIEDESKEKTKIVIIEHPSLTPNQMVQEICHQLGIKKPSRNRFENLNQLRKKLNSLNEEKIRPIIIVDEGQMLKNRPDTLQELRVLLNFSLLDRFLLTFFLVGQKPLETLLRKTPEFWQRLPVRFFLNTLDRADTEAMIKFRLKKSGLEKDLFDKDAYDAIHSCSKGCARVICSLGDLCLLIGFSLKRNIIDFTIVQKAHEDMVKSSQGIHYFQFVKENKDVNSPSDTD